MAVNSKPVSLATLRGVTWHAVSVEKMAKPVP